MNNTILSLIHEQTSPLFRIMWASNLEDPAKRHFDNNISAFHAGNGIILSVAHNLRIENPLVKTIDEKTFRENLLAHLNPAQAALFNQCYLHDEKTGKRHLNAPNAGIIQNINDTFRQVGFDTRWLTLMEKRISIPYLIIQFNNNLFYNEIDLSGNFSGGSYFHEPSLNRHTYLLELELVHAHYSEDIAVYRIANADQAIISKLPSLPIDFDIPARESDHLFCLQSSPGGSLGRLLNKAHIEGYLDHHNVFHDRIGGNYILEGIRYLIKGYFRFGSSGAPYVKFNEETGQFNIIAIQSEASPIQLSINNNRDGNYQYVNAIASPLFLIKEQLLSMPEFAA